MPLEVPVRYRVVNRGGNKVRVAFRKGTNKVVEAKNLKTGATHTPKEFARDRKRRRKSVPSDDGMMAA